MKFYRTTGNCLLNLDRIESVLLQEDGTFVAVGATGKKYTDLTEDDIERIMDYNDFLIK
jgi:hypothetical protein